MKKLKVEATGSGVATRRGGLGWPGSMDLSPWLPSGSRDATAGCRTVPVRAFFGPKPRASCFKPSSGYIRVHPCNKKIKKYGKAHQGNIGHLARTEGAGG